MNISRCLFEWISIDGSFLSRGWKNLSRAHDYGFDTAKNTRALSFELWKKILVPHDLKSSFAVLYAAA